MSKADQIMKSKMLLHEAINAASSVTDNPTIDEARFHMRQALNKMDKLAKSHLAKKETMNNTQFENWWGKIVSGTGAASHTPISGEAKNKILSHLDMMIAEETQKLNDLEVQSQDQTNSDLLND